MCYPDTLCCFVCAIHRLVLKPQDILAPAPVSPFHITELAQGVNAAHYRQKCQSGYQCSFQSACTAHHRIKSSKRITLTDLVTLRVYIATRNTRTVTWARNRLRIAPHPNVKLIHPDSTTVLVSAAGSRLSFGKIYSQCFHTQAQHHQPTQQDASNYNGYGCCRCCTINSPNRYKYRI